jgi:hypothetical protein
MAAILSELLLPQAILDVISRIKGGRGPLSTWLGFQPKGFDPDNVSLTGPNVLRDPAGVRGGGGGSLRYYTYRIFDHTRTTLKLRAPGTGPGTISQQPMGQNTVVVCRFHDKIPLNYEFLGNLSPMVGPNSQIDPAGQSYVMQMEEALARKGHQTIEVLAAGMMRDSLYMVQVGDDWWPQFAAPTGTQIGFQVPFQVPSGNKAQLNMLGAGNILTVPWNNPGSLILSNCEQIKAAYVQLSGYPLTDDWINSTLWPAIISNTQIRNAAGTANKPFAEYKRVDEGGMEGTGPANQFSAEIVGIPWLKWHFCDDVVVLNSDIDVSYLPIPAGSVPAAANVAKLVPDNLCIFTTQPSPGDWCRLIEGGEYVVENEGMPGALRTGWYAWHQYVTQPSQIELIVLLNCVPALYRPNVLAPATVIF